MGRRQARVCEMHTLPQAAQAAIRDDLEGTHKYAAHEMGDVAARYRWEDDSPTASIPDPGERASLSRR